MHGAGLPARLRDPPLVRAGAGPGAARRRRTSTWPAGSSWVRRRSTAGCWPRPASPLPGRHRLPRRRDPRPRRDGGAPAQRADEIVRLEAVAEAAGRRGRDGRGFAGARSPTRLPRRTADAAGLKSVIAYRFGLDFDPARRPRAEVAAAAGEWLGAAVRRRRPRGSTDPVLLRTCSGRASTAACRCSSTSASATPDLYLHRCDPLLMTGFLRASRPRGVPVMLLHCYPFHRRPATWPRCSRMCTSTSGWR